MPALTPLASAVELKPAANRVIRFDLVLGGLFLAALWFVLCRHLSGEWRVNEQYNYGWFVPFFALFLFWQRWEDRPRAYGPNLQRPTRLRRGRAPPWRASNPPPPGTGSAVASIQRTLLATVVAAIGLFLLLPIRLFEMGDPDWRPLSWLHASVVVAITLFAVWSAGGRPWLRHFAFPIVFFLVAVPWVTPIEVPVIQGLMQFVAAIATEAVALLGIPAELEGNLIRINNGLVGVNEACSGVRSLQTSLMIGLLFGELKRLSISRRVLLVALAVAIAIIANLGRAVFLVWIAATKNVAEVDRWHDLAGYTIVGLVFVGSLVLATWLAGRQRSEVEGRRSEVRNQSSEIRNQTPSTEHSASHHPSSFILHPVYLAVALCWIVAVEIAASSWYRAHETNLMATARWSVRWPQSAPNFHEIKIQEGIKNTLRFDAGREVAWHEDADSANADIYLLYFFRWEPGTSTVLRARAHRPDICLPSAGWRQTADDGVRMYRVTDNFAVPFRHFAFTRKGTTHHQPVYAHTFFCLREDTIRRGEASPLNDDRPDKWSRSDRWRVVREGIRNPGQQVMEFLMVSAHEHSNAEAEEQFARLVPDLIEIKAPTDQTTNH